MIIAHTWDGHPLPDREHARIQLYAHGSDIVLRCDAPYRGDPPPNAPAGPTDALWNHEVVEWFCVGQQEHYLEVELGPHGHHLVLQLEGVRNAVRSKLPMSYRAQLLGERWIGEARFPSAWLPTGPRTANAYRIHGTDTRHYHCATPVPGPAPDFHRLHLFEPLPPIATFDDTDLAHWATP